MLVVCADLEKDCDLLLLVTPRPDTCHCVTVHCMNAWNQTMRAERAWEVISLCWCGGITSPFLFTITCQNSGILAAFILLNERKAIWLSSFTTQVRKLRSGGEKGFTQLHTVTSACLRCTELSVLEQQDEQGQMERLV